MIAPGNCEDGTSPLRTAGIELWVQGRTRPAPLSRAKVEQLGGTKTSVDVQAYEGPAASPALTVDKPDPAWQFVAAIPAVDTGAKDADRGRARRQRRSPTIRQLEAAFRLILRPATRPPRKSTRSWPSAASM